MKKLLNLRPKKQAPTKGRLNAPALRKQVEELLIPEEELNAHNWRWRDLLDTTEPDATISCVCGAPLPIREYADDETVVCDICGYFVNRSEI